MLNVIGETANTCLNSLWFDLIGVETTIYRIQCEEANHYTKKAVKKVPNVYRY